jgi:hypothetical protein
MANWFESALQEVATAAGVDAKVLTENVIKDLTPGLTAYLTPIVVDAVNTELVKAPFGSELVTIVDPVITSAVADIVAQLTAKLP